MPHYTNDKKLVVTYDELVPMFYKTMDYLKSYVYICEKRGFGLKRVARGHNGGKALILFDSLPEKIRFQLDDLRVGNHTLEQFFEVDPEAVRFYQSFRFADNRSISDNLQSVYITNASVIQAVMKLKDARIESVRTLQNKYPRDLWKTLHNDAMSFISVTQDEAEKGKVPVLMRKFGLVCDLPKNIDRFREKCEKFTENSYMSLISDKHGNNNSRKADDAVTGVLESIFATKADKPTYREVSEAYSGFLSGYVEVISNATGEVYNPAQFKPLSQSTIYNYLSSWKSKIATFAIRSGDRQKLMAQFKPSHKLEKSQYAGSLVSVDDRQPPFEYAQSHRAWFYLGIDDASECYISWVHGKDKKGMIVPFYRQMVRNCNEWGVGIPMELEAESSLNSTLKDGLLIPGNMFDYVRIEANNARGKIIERYNQYMRYGEEKSLPGWIARPFARSESNQAGSTNVPMLPYEHIVEQTLTLIQKWNNSPHSVHKTKSRWEVYMENQNPDIKPINWHGILKHIGYKTSTSCKVGEVKLQHGAYLLGDNGEIYLGERLINLMAMIEGEQIDVYWLDDNDGNVMKAFAYMGNQFICELLPKPSYKRARAEQTDDDMQAREIMSSYVATIEAFGKRQRQSIEKVTVIDNRTTAISDKFQIRGLEPTSNICTSDLSYDVQDVEVLPELPEDDFNCELIGVETEFKPNSQRSLRDRF
jgi:hypothetical protein